MAAKAIAYGILAARQHRAAATSAAAPPVEPTAAMRTVQPWWRVKR